MNQLNDMNRRKRSYEMHALDQAAQSYHGSMVASSQSYQWHEMDYSSPTMDATRFAPTSAPVQYNNTGMMSFSPVDYSRPEYAYTTPYSENDASMSVQTSNMYRVGPFRYTELSNMDGDSASVSQDSIYSRSTRLHSLTDSERRDSQPNSILSSHDVRRESEGYDRMFPMTPIDSDHRHRDSCASEHHTLDVSNLAAVGECASTTAMPTASQFIVPKPPSIPNAGDEPESPNRANHSALTSPTTINFQDGATADVAKGLKPRRLPRSKSANASVGDGAALEKASKLRARQAHSLVERKYRDNLNLKISQLHQTLQTTRYGPKTTSRSPLKEIKSDYFDEETIVSSDIPNEKSSTGSTPTGPKVRKSDVLTEAMSYVNAAEVEMRHMSEEIIRLSAQVKALEKSKRCENCNLLQQMVTLQVEGQEQ